MLLALVGLVVGQEVEEAEALAVEEVAKEEKVEEVAKVEEVDEEQEVRRGRQQVGGDPVAAVDLGLEERQGRQEEGGEAEEAGEDACEECEEAWDYVEFLKTSVNEKVSGGKLDEKLSM